MSITKETISKLEELTMLKLSASEKKALMPELNKIVELVNKLSELDTSGTEPLKHVNKHAQPLRKDIIEASLDRDTVLKNAKEREGHFFKVPKVIKVIKVNKDKE